MTTKAKIKFIALAIFFVSAPYLSYGQEESSSLKGDEYYKKSEDFSGKNPDSVFHYIKLASEEYQKVEDWENYIKCLNAFSIISFYTNKQEDRRKYASQALIESEKHLDPDNVMRAISLNNHSYCLVDIGNYTEAITQFKEVLRIKRLANDMKRLVPSLKNLGDSYNRLGDLDQALLYYDEAISLGNEDTKYLSNNNKADIHRNIGLVYLSKNDFKKSLDNLQKARNLIPRNPDKKNYFHYNKSIKLNNDLARIYLHLNQFDSLQYYVNESFRLCTGNHEFKKDEGYKLLGNYFLNNKEYSKAIHNLQIAKDFNLKNYKKFKKHKSFSEIGNLLASAYSEVGEFEKSITQYKNAIRNLKNNESIDSEFSIPSADNIYEPLNAIKSYTGIGEIYLSKFDKSAKIEDLESAYNSFENSSLLVSQVRISMQEETSLLRYSEIAIPIYESCIATALKLYNITKEQKYLVEAFNYNEKSKATLLLESINKSAASQISNIPDSLLLMEKGYKGQITGLNKLIYDAENVLEDKDQIKIDQLKRQLFKDTEDYDALIRIFEKEYPKYYDIKYNTKTAGISDIQKYLQNTNIQIIEFFYGNDNTYVFSISKDEIKVNTVPNQENLLSEIQRIKDYLSTPPSGNNIQTELNAYIQSSKNIYDQFVKDAIFPESKHLIIITDGSFGYIPFEALTISEPNSQNVSFSLENQSYLIEDYTISYSYSSTLFLNSLRNNKIEAQNDFCGIAPSFGLLNDKQTRVCNENELYSLQCSENEVLKIKERLGGKVLLGKEATLLNTKEEISNSRIIHLATHACLDDKNPEFNKIYLADDYLSNNDLYNLKLNSELAVLSACETGSGKLAKGEGVMSLARGFIYAGCPSIIMSLWSIDDCATSKIMINFYDELYTGEMKTEALRNAKLKYIKEAKKANQHPYYWAAFVQIGNYNPIEISSFSTYLFYSLGLLLIGLMAFFGKNIFKKP